MRISQKLKFKSQNLAGGYTLVELLAVTSIIVIVTGLIVGVLHSTLRGGSKTKITNDVSQNGNYALSVISNIALNAESVTNVGGTDVSDCTTLQQGDSIEFKKADGSRLSFSCASDSIASSSGTTTTYLIDNASVKVDPVSCNFSCFQSDANPYSSPIIGVSFTVSQSKGSSFENLASSSFKTSVTMRNYNPR